MAVVGGAFDVHRELAKVGSASSCPTSRMLCVASWPDDSSNYANRCIAQLFELPWKELAAHDMSPGALPVLGELPPMPPARRHSARCGSAWPLLVVCNSMVRRAVSSATPVETRLPQIGSPSTFAPKGLVSIRPAMHSR